jgi:hypothetical protein
VIYSADADADRAFFRDVLAMEHVDAGDGWLTSSSGRAPGVISYSKALIFPSREAISAPNSGCRRVSGRNVEGSGLRLPQWILTTIGRVVNTSPAVLMNDR